MEQQPVEILLAEDNDADVFLIREALSWGSVPKRVNVVIDGEEALRYLRKVDKYRTAARPDLILLDLNLPKIDGRDVLETIKYDSDLRHIPVVVLSSSTAEGDVLSCYENYANCYLSKPKNLDEFLDLIHEIEAYWLRSVALPAM